MGRRVRRGAERPGDAVAASLRIVAVGRARFPERALFERYAARLTPPLALTELPDGNGSPVEIRRREARAIQAALDARDLLVALDGSGQAWSSERLARALSGWRDEGRAVVFALGGAEGLDATVRERAGMVLSLGPATWPHLLARIMLAEQLYRAATILSGHPYHRG